jgi:Leucine-rich repeat (LRR) protein
MSSEPSFVVAEIGTSKEVLEGLEPHHNLKHLQISGYRSGTSPDWLVSTVSVTCLQTLHLEDCRELQVLPSLESLPLLTKLKLNNMWKVTQITVPSLEELVLIKMPQLERCSCNSVRDLNSSLKVLMVKECRVLKVFPLFESCAKLGIDQQSWLSRISELTIHDCPCLTVSNSLPPSSSVCRLSISGVLTLPMIEGSTNRELEIGSLFSKYPGNLDGKILAFHNLRALTSLILQQNGLGISPVSLECFRQLISLKSLEINGCGDIIFSSDVLLEHAHEDMGDINFNALPSLKHLSISECGITGKWLSVMLRHAPALEELSLCRCDQISGLLIEGGECSSSNHTSTPRTSSAGNPDGTVTGSTPEGLLRIPSDSVSSLKRMSILWCEELAFQGNKEGFSVFTSLGMPQADHVFGADIRKQRAAKRKMASPVFTWQT